MLMVTITKGEAMPLLRCKSCNLPIESAAGGCVIYAQGMGEGESERVSLVHKGPCEVEFMAQMENDAGRPAVMELAEYLRKFGPAA